MRRRRCEGREESREEKRRKRREVSIKISIVFFLMIRRPPRSTQSRSSAASDVYKRQFPQCILHQPLKPMRRKKALHTVPVV